MIASCEKAKWLGFMTYCLVCCLQGSISLPCVMAESRKSSKTYTFSGVITGFLCLGSSAVAFCVCQIEAHNTSVEDIVHKYKNVKFVPAHVEM